MDVLFLIGISLPLVYLFLALDRGGPLGNYSSPSSAPRRAPACSVTGTSVAAPPCGCCIRSSGFFPANACRALVHRRLVPGLSLAWYRISGSRAGTIRWTGDRITSFATRQFAAVALGMLGTGIALWALFPAGKTGWVRRTFLPPGPGVLPCGLWHDSVHVRDRRSAATGLHPGPLRAMGECSLSIYILHSVIIAWIIGPADILLPLPQFLLCISVFAGGMCAFAYLMRHIRPAAAGRSFVVRLFLGG